MLLGFADFSITLVYVLCIASALVCVIYGVVNWNKGNGNGESRSEEMDKGGKS